MNQTVRRTGMLPAIAVALCAGSTHAQPPLATAALERLHVACCCNSSLQACLARSGAPCAIASHLHRFVLWRAEVDSSADSVLAQTRTRYATLTDTVRHEIAPLAGTAAGEGPVTIVAYVSAQCGLCKRVVGQLHDSVTAGTLGTTVRLIAKPFGTTRGERALVVAAQEGRFWELFGALREHIARLTDESLCTIADSVGIGRAVMRAGLADGRVLEHCQRSTAEARGHGVSVVPTLFIDGRRYASYKNPEWVADAARFAATGECAGR